MATASWHFTGEKDKIVETNHWGMMHYAGKFSAATVDDAVHGKVLASKLEKQDAVHELMPWYNVLRPAKPIPLPGRRQELGLWVKGASDWGRVIYILRDAHGERWTSVGTKDQYNCDDPHSWSQFDFDGWRYLTFELPGHYGWDNFRKYGTTWWRADGEEGASSNIVGFAAGVGSHCHRTADAYPLCQRRRAPSLRIQSVSARCWLNTTVLRTRRRKLFALAVCGCRRRRRFRIFPIQSLRLSAKEQAAPLGELKLEAPDTLL